MVNYMSAPLKVFLRGAAHTYRIFFHILTFALVYAIINSNISACGNKPAVPKNAGRETRYIALVRSLRNGCVREIKKKIG